MVAALFAAAIWLPAKPTQPNPSYSAAHYKEKDAKREKTFWQRTTDDPVAAFTLWLLIFNGILAIATVKLWLSTDRLVRSAEETARRQLRAYVYVEGSSIEINEMDEFDKLRIIVTNSGQTPANRVRADFFAVIISNGEPDFKEVGIRERNAITIPASKPIASLVDISWVKKEQQAAFFAGEAKMYCWGGIEYTDCFGEKQTASVRFIHFGGPGWRRRSSEYCEEGNEAT